jgi:hypothetical protein
MIFIITAFGRLGMLLPAPIYNRSATYFDTPSSIIDTNADGMDLDTEFDGLSVFELGQSDTRGSESISSISTSAVNGRISTCRQFRRLALMAGT